MIIICLIPNWMPLSMWDLEVQKSSPPYNNQKFQGFSLMTFTFYLGLSFQKVRGENQMDVFLYIHNANIQYYKCAMWLAQLYHLCSYYLVLKPTLCFLLQFYGIVSFNFHVPTSLLFYLSNEEIFHLECASCSFQRVDNLAENQSNILREKG